MKPSWQMNRCTRVGHTVLYSLPTWLTFLYAPEKQSWTKGSSQGWQGEGDQLGMDSWNWASLFLLFFICQQLS